MPLNIKIGVLKMFFETSATGSFFINDTFSKNDRQIYGILK